MDKIIFNTEAIVNSLLLLGFNEIDPLLFYLIFDNLLKNLKYDKQYDLLLNDKNYKGELEYSEPKEFSAPFLECIDIKVGYKFKDGFNLESNVAPLFDLDGKYTFEDYIKTKNNLLLACYIEKKINIKKIMLEKINRLSLEHLDNFSSFLSDKEKMILSQMFGIKTNEEKLIKNLHNKYDKIYNQEAEDISKTVEYMKTNLKLRK